MRLRPSTYLLMSGPLDLTDRAALLLHRRRARSEAFFLHEIAADQLQERLEEVNRRFTEIALVTGFPEFWAKRFPGATVVPDDDVLNLAPGTHDLVIHAMALHWASDPIGQIIQSRRALRGDGLFLSVALGGETLSELRIALAEAESLFRGGLSPRVLPMADLRDMGAVLQRAGMALPVVDRDRLSVSYADAMALMRELRAMGEANAISERDRRIPPRGFFRETARIYRARFPDEDDPNRIKATFELQFLSGWAPGEGQPQPLRPGSARTRLADALGTDETSLRDDSPSGAD